MEQRSRATLDDLTDVQRGESQVYLETMQSLKNHPGWKMLEGWLSEQIEHTSVAVETEENPTALARNVGRLQALRLLRSRVDREIDYYIKLFKREL